MRVPPLPRPASPSPDASAAREALVAGLEALETTDVLALCQRFSRQPDRLGLYLAVLRRRTGTRAQLAAALVCFDLARQGSASAQREFGALAATLRQLARDARLVGTLLQGDPYLVRLWGDCLRALAGADPREGRYALDDEAGPVGELVLLSEEDMEGGWEELVVSEEEVSGGEMDPATRARQEASRQALRQGLEVYLAASAGPDGARPFATATAQDLERLERLLHRASSHAAHLPAAAGLASLGHLFLGAHLRHRTLFGRPNPQRRAALRTGLTALPTRVEALEVASLFSLGGPAAEAGLAKVVELLWDFVAYCAEARLDPRASQTVERYLAADRVPPPVLASHDERRRR